MTSDETDPLPSLGELLGIDVLADLPELPDQVWERALDIATDPGTAAVDISLIPDDEIDPEVVTVDSLDLDPVLDSDADLAGAGGTDPALDDANSEPSSGDEAAPSDFTDNVDEPDLDA
ncbi:MULTISPECIES: hypothetical protein [Rhodococcus]|uniref:hypothetical protein n=1 Tax=Rhodococcus TaxID=1827 RepID=UPI001324BE23|nr:MULTISPECIES: hypothetical protein [Rhodococcus]MXQ76616.1 hypothetical protein [Rhodococcus rhodochrous]BDB60600.1 hypothetical protein RDE2_23940 [Rhodococcus sp. RDE2]